MGKHSDHDKRKDKRDDKDERDERQLREDDRKDKRDRDDDRDDRNKRDDDRCSKKDDREDRKEKNDDDKGRDGERASERGDDGGRDRGNDADRPGGGDDTVDRSDASKGQKISSGGGDDKVTGSAHRDGIKTGGGDDVVYAGGGNDKVNTGGGNDYIDAGDGHDRVNAGGGDDFVKGGAGNDKLYGNGGYDTAVYSGSVFDYAWREGRGNAFHVKDMNTADGDEGRDTLKHFEALQFTDFTLKLDENNAALVQAEDAATDEDTGIDLSFKAFDFDCGKVSVESVSISGGGSISLADGFTEIRAGMGKGAEFGLRFEPGDAYDYLNEGESVTETVTVVVSDGQGAYTTKTFEITINGRDDAPAVVQPLDATVAYDADPATQEDGVTELTGQISSTGGVEGAEKSYSVVSGGALGALTVAADGSFAYALDNASDAVQSLAEGETAIETFEIEVTDGEGNVDVVTVELTVSGTNDAPTISSVGTPVAATEAAPSVSGQVAASDVDNGDVLSYAVEGDGQGSYGSILMNAETGEWTFAADPGAQAFKALGAGESAVQQFVVEVSDGKGGTTTDIIEIEIQGTNDGPVIDNVSYLSDAVVEDGVAVASGVIEASDADAGDSLAFSAEAPQGSYGSLVVDPETGEWTYTMDNAAAQSLGAGQVATESFVVSVTDAQGEVATSTVTVTVTGTNDAPVISATGTPAAPATEAAPTLSGSVSASDMDEGDVLAYAVDGPATGDYGSLVLDAATGEWTFTVDPDAPAVQALGAGEVASQSFMISVSDGNGGTATQELVVEVAGSNSAPTLSAVSQDVSELVEDGVIFATGRVQGSDADAGDSLAYAVQGGTYGTPTVDAEGNWSYALDNASDAVQSLGAGESLTESFEITVTDSQGATDTVTIELTITGTNDAPTVSSVGTPATASEAQLVTTGQVAASDVDANDVLAYDATGASTTYGTFGVDATTGEWTFTLDPNAPAVQALGAGEQAVEEFVVTVSDGNGGTTTATVPITITGSNGAPVIEASTRDAGPNLVEDGASVASGQIVASDPDAGDSLAYVAQGNGQGAYGALSIGQDGRWTYTLDQASDAVQALAEGEVVTEQFVIEVTDAQGATVTETIEITVTGTNDAPVASAAAPATAASASTPTLSGQVDASDVDAGDALTFATDGSGIGTYGAFSVDPDTGAWSFQLDESAPAFTALGAGEQATEDFVVNVSDGRGGVTPTTISIVIEGANEAPVVTQVIYDNTAVIEELPYEGAGRVVATDADGDAFTFGIENPTSPYGTFSIDPTTGEWIFQLDNASEAVQSLSQGQQVLQSATVTVTDTLGAQTTETITISVTGTNDAPMVEGVTYAAGNLATEDAATLTGTVDVSDVDAQDVLTYSILGQGAGNYGSLSIDETGQWTYTGDAAAMASLGAGEIATETFYVYASDGSGGSDGTVQTEVTIQVQGSNSDPVISDVYYYASSLTEDDPVYSASGYVIASDADTSDTLTMSVIGDGVGTYGTLYMSEGGNWTYTLDNTLEAVQALGAGQLAEDEFFFQVSDGNGGVVSERIAIEVVGANDAPVLDGVTYNNGGQLSEDNVLEAAGQISVSDVDTSDVFIFNIQNDGAGTYGNLTVAQDGSFRYALNNDSAAVQDLVGGQVVTDTFSVDISDGNGGTVSTQLEFDVTGADDRPLTVLNFEGIYAGGKSKLPAGYGGFDWDANTWLVQGINYGAGWNKGTTSGKNAIFDAAGNGMSFTRGGEVFDFEKLNMAAATDLAATAVITGLLNGEIVGIQEVEITRNESREVFLDDSIFDFVDEIRIDGAGPVVMDDLGFYL